MMAATTTIRVDHDEIAELYAICVELRSVALERHDRVRWARLNTLVAKLNFAHQEVDAAGYAGPLASTDVADPRD